MRKLMLAMLVWDIYRRDHLRERLLRQIHHHPLRDRFHRRHRPGVIVDPRDWAVTSAMVSEVDAAFPSLGSTSGPTSTGLRLAQYREISQQFHCSSVAGAYATARVDWFEVWPEFRVLGIERLVQNV